MTGFVNSKNADVPSLTPALTLSEMLKPVKIDFSFYRLGYPSGERKDMKNIFHIFSNMFIIAFNIINVIKNLSFSYNQLKSFTRKI